MTKHIEDFCEDKAREGEGLFAVAYALLKVAEAQQSLAVHVKYLGNGDASTTLGAIEAFGMHLGEKIDDLTGAIRDGLSDASTLTKKA